MTDRQNKIERYCEKVGTNVTFSRITSEAGSYRFVCENKEKCEKDGGCKHNIASHTELIYRCSWK